VWTKSIAFVNLFAKSIIIHKDQKIVLEEAEHPCICRSIFKKNYHTYLLHIVHLSTRPFATVPHPSNMIGYELSIENLCPILCRISIILSTHINYFVNPCQLFCQPISIILSKYISIILSNHFNYFFSIKADFYQ